MPSRVGATTLPGAGAVVLREERPGRVGDLGQARARPSRTRRPPRSSRTGSSPRGGGAAPPDRSPSRSRTASTRCSSVFGPAIVPSLVTWPTRTTAIPSPFASSISRERGLADLADAAGRAVELVDGRRSGSSRRRASAGRSARRDLDDPPDVVLGEDRGSRSPAGPARRPRRAARRRTWAADSSPVAYRTRPSVAATARDAGRRLEQERRLADARLAAERTSEPGTSPPPRTRSSSPMPDRRAAGRRRRRRAERRRRAPRRPDAPRRGRAGARRLAGRRSRRGVFQAPHARHWPSQRRNASPQAWQT